MRNRDRVIVFLCGFTIGLFLVGTILSRRAAREADSVDPWVAHNATQIAEGAESLPDGIVPALKRGRIIAFGMLPIDGKQKERVWHMNYDESYPYVRIVEDIDSGSIRYMAADQISIRLKEGVDVTALTPALEDLELRLRMFNRSAGIAVVGVLDTQIDAVPRTIEALQPYADLTEAITPDYLEIQARALAEADGLR